MKRILVVDDELRIIKILEEFLTVKGFEVMTSLGGENVQEILAADKKIDLIILDMKMPKTTGMAILTEMKDKKINIPVIIFTGSVDMKKYRNELKEMGYDYLDALYKPVNLQELLDKVNSKLS
jgi:DNA-binding NtrC family response regulator